MLPEFRKPAICIRMFYCTDVFSLARNMLCGSCIRHLHICLVIVFFAWLSICYPVGCIFLIVFVFLILSSIPCETCGCVFLRFQQVLREIIFRRTLSELTASSSLNNLFLIEFHCFIVTFRLFSSPRIWFPLRLMCLLTDLHACFLFKSPKLPLFCINFT